MITHSRSIERIVCNIILFFTPLSIPIAQALIEMGEAMKQMADVKYSLDDNIKQNFLEPLHHLQTKDLKEVMVRLLEKLLYTRVRGFAYKFDLH